MIYIVITSVVLGVFFIYDYLVYGKIKKEIKSIRKLFVNR